jgi:pilus assembly protein CpaB
MFVILLALVTGSLAAFGVSRLRPGAPGKIKTETTPVLVAAVDISRGRMVTAGDLKVSEWPKGNLPEKTIAKIEDAVGRATAIPIPAGDLVLETKLAAKDAGRGLAALVPIGMRAYTIQTSRIASSVAGFVLPGNRVDILLNLHGNQNDSTGGGSTTTLLQSIEILAVDQRLDAPTDNKVNPKDLGSVTLLVTPDQAALLDLGQSLGQLTLSLRNPEDGKQAEAQPATLVDIRLRQEKPGSAKPAVEKDDRHLSTLIPKGMRAFTVQTPRIATSVAGFVLPGNEVDVLLNVKGNQKDGSGGSISSTMPAVKIIAVDQRLDSPDNTDKFNPKEIGSVTLQVTPEQAALLDLAQNAGQITLSLRNTEDDDNRSIGPATLSDIALIGAKPIVLAQHTAPATAEVYKIETLRGSQRGRVDIKLRP